MADVDRAPAIKPTVLPESSSMAQYIREKGDRLMAIYRVRRKTSPVVERNPVLMPLRCSLTMFLHCFREKGTMVMAIVASINRKIFFHG